MSRCVLGIDIGTSGCKVLAIDENCRLLASVTKPYPCYSPNAGWSEQNPLDWWSATINGIKEILPLLNGSSVCAVGLSGQMHGMVALDKDDRILRPAILWNDQRTKKQCDYIIDAVGGIDALLHFTNNSMLTGFTAGKILWMKENEPDNYDKTAAILNPKDYIRFCMTGEKFTDVSDASGTGLFDVENNCWNIELIEKAGLRKDIFQPFVESSEICAYVSDEVCSLTGLPRGCPVAGGGGDAVLSTIGMGIGASNQLAVMLGTSGVVSMHTDNFFENKGANLQFSRACIPGSYHIMGVTLSAAGSYKWFCDTFGEYETAIEKAGGISAFFQLDALAAASPIGSNGLLFLPYLQGERCPINDANAKACFIGASSQSTKGDFTRSVLEGVAFSLKQVLNLIQDGSGKKAMSVVLAGGGAKSPLWRQIFADVFNIPVITLEGSSEGSGFGAAIVAGVGAGIFKDIEEPLSTLKEKSIEYPSKKSAEIYAQMYRKYCKLYDSLKDVFNDN